MAKRVRAISPWLRLKIGSGNARVERSAVDPVDMGVVGLHRHVLLTDRPLQLVLTLRGSDALLGRAKVRPVLQRFHLQIFQREVERLIVKRAADVVVRGHGLKSERCSQVGKRLQLRHLRLCEIALELQQLKFDLKVIVLADGAGPVTDFHNIQCVLVALQIVLREFQRGFGKLHVDELRTHLKRQRAFIIGDLRHGNGGGAFRGFQPVLPFVAALDEIAEPRIGFCGTLQIGAALRAGGEDRQVIPIDEQAGIRAQVGRGLLGLALLDGRARGQKRMVVLQSQCIGLIERDVHGRGHRGRRLRERARARGENKGNAGGRQGKWDTAATGNKHSLSFQSSPPCP